MICIYSQNNTNYEANGDAVLDPISCDLEITINGAWSLTLEHPYDPEGKYKYIVEGAVIRADIRCIRELTGVRQRFRIYDYKKGLHSVTAIAFPIAMESTYDAPIDNLVIQNKTGIQAMADLQTKTNKYTLATDITKIASSSFANTNVNSAIASGSDNCFIKVWGGEILYDNLTFNVKSRIGDTEAGDHQVTYGHNLTDITYTKDDSGLITRIYPISQDGIRLNGTGYVDSPKLSDYPVIHSHFIQAPYTLINTDAASPSQTAQQTRTSGVAVNTSANTLALSSYSTALAAGYEPEYIKGIHQEIIQAVQTMALASVISTSLYNYLNGIISNAMSFMSELEQPAWDWMGSWEDGWKYGNENGYAVSRYVKIGKTWSYFNAEGYWEEPRDDSGTWDWYQAQADPGRRYGNFTHYYAHNENVYITMSGTLTKYYFDSDGWYDDSKTEASTWDWHGSGTASDPYWFGESGATSEESNKYAHDCWLFIDGSLYFFDHFGYYTPGNKFADYQWDWVETSDGFWFGNAIDQTYGAVYLKSQWAKINGDWIYFDENGYAVQENASQSAAVEVFTTGMAGLKTVVDAQTTILYDLLYSLMTQYANSRYAAGVDVPAVTITVDMADLSKTIEYAGFENLETVKLGDAVICTDNEHNISMTSRVIGLTYDCIRDYNSTVVIGKAGASISSIVGNANSEVVTGGFDTTALEAQIAALQGKVGDIFMNDASIVSNGVGRFAIKPGTNISISRSGNTLTISADAGALEYFIETENTLYGHDTTTKYLRNDVDYKFDSGVVMRNYSQRNDIDHNYYKHTASNVDNNDIVGYHAGEIDSLLSTYANIAQGFCIISKVASHCTFTYEYFNSQYPADESSPTYSSTYSYDSANKNVTTLLPSRMGDVSATCDTFTYNDETYYIVADGATWDWLTPQTNIEDILDLGKYVKEFEYNYTILNEQGTNVFNTLGEYGLAVVKAHKQRNSYNGIAKKDGLAFFAGGTDANGSDAPIKIYDDGTAEGLVTEVDLDKKQDKLIEGANIHIGADGKTISATDTDEIAELEDVSLTNLADGEILKYNGTTQKWENAEDSGGSEVEANPSGTATDTLTKLGIDGTVYEIQGGGGGGSTYFGVFVDADNVIQPFINITDTQIHTYTATKDCAVAYYIPNDTNTDVYIKLDGIIVGGQYGQYINATSGIVYMKKGQVFSYQTTYTASSGAGYTVYGLQSGSETRFFQPIIYSTEEREVGVGENNKPLYQKTIESGSIPADSNATTGLTNIESYHVIAIEVINLSNNTEFSPNQISMYNYQGAGTWYGNVFLTNNELKFNNNSRENAIKVRAVIQYTKTTDVAGSAQYTTLGVPAHHYDGNEKIVGTYFGETLYERTLNFTQDNRIYYIPNTTYVKKLVKHNGECTKDNFDFQIPYYDGTDYLSVGNDSNGVRIYSSNYFVGAVYELTIQYTKTT